MRLRNCSEQLALTEAQQFSGCIKPAVVAALLLYFNCASGIEKRQDPDEQIITLH